ncbi:efflux RND transporter permease subunit [candidate division KSB1 bacterium]|nr:efflux RND transporter permease subunit [candidate division KSB1 bacterium]
MRKLTEFSVKYPITVLMMVLAILLLGYISFQKLNVDLFPDLNNPRLFIEIKSGERPPEEIEKRYVENIESLAIRQRNVLQVSSLSQVGSAQVIVEYTWKSDMDEAFLDLQKALSTLSQDSDLDELTITQHDPNAAPILLLGLSHPEVTDMNELRLVAENYLRNELIRLEGIAEVELLGQEEKEVVVETDEYLLNAYNVTPATVVNRIRSYNRNSSGGSIVEMGRKYVIKGVGEFQSIDDIAGVVVAYKTETVNAGNEGNRVPVFLRDVATLQMSNRKPENIVRINQRRCMALAVYKETKFNTLRAVSNFSAALENLRKALPGYDLAIIQNQGEFISAAVNEVKSSALIGILLAVVVLYLFLRHIGVTAIISIAIPISVVATFNLMYFNGLTLNIMTLGGLALGAGMLVDNAIVVMENIFRNREEGLSLRQASIEGAAQVGGAITGSTLTTIVVFLPIVYLHGSAGELFKDQAWTVAFSLLASLVVSLLFIPMLSARMLRERAVKTSTQSLRFPGYRRFLERVLERRYWVILTALILIAIAIVLIPIIGSEFMPRAQEKTFSIDLRLSEGTELYRTESTVADLEVLIQEALGSQIIHMYSKIGPSVSLNESQKEVFENENSATIKLILKEEGFSAQHILDRINIILAAVPDMEAQVVQEQTAVQMSLGTEIAPLIVEVSGQELERIQALTDQIGERLASMPQLNNIRTSFDKGRPEVEVVIDRNRAGMLNVNLDDVIGQLQDQLMGKEAGQWDYRGEMQDITLRMPPVDLAQLGDVVVNSNNTQVRLDEIADIRFITAPREISRRNQVRIGTVTAHIVSDEPFDHVVKAAEEKLSDIPLPADYRIRITGEEEKRQDAFGNLKFALILSIILVYMVLASEFESLLHPFTIILTIPLAAVGSVLLFFILGKSFNMMAYIGIIMLAGIAVNDSIILVDAILQHRRNGMVLREAVLAAGQQRIRPILITSLTTILAMVPLTIGFGQGVALREPLALAVIGGLTTSTILTLVVIPCVYETLERWKERLQKAV